MQGMTKNDFIILELSLFQFDAPFNTKRDFFEDVYTILNFK